MLNAVHLMQLSTRLVLTLLTICFCQALSRSDARAMGADPSQFVAVRTMCPPLKRYTPEQAKQLGEARKKLRAVDPKSILLDTNDDYLTLREQCRAIEGK